MKVICWNVNSVNQRLEHVKQILKEERPDILMLQELKCETHKFPEFAFEGLGYNYLVKGQKTFNGVAIFSKTPLDETITELPSYDIDNEDEQARFVEATTTIEGKFWRFISVYVPNGSEVGSDKYAYKFRFYERLQKHVELLQTYDEHLVIGGDFNVCYNDIDLYEPKNFENGICYSLKERKALRSFMNLDLFDSFRALNPEMQKFSWWDYRAGSYQQNKGLRIDYIFANPKATNTLKSADILEQYRKLQKPSDHAPIIAEY